MMHSKDEYENAVLKKLIELDFEQLIDSKKKQLEVSLTNNPGVILNWHTDQTATNAYSIDKVSCSDHYAYSATTNMEASIKEMNKGESLAFNRVNWTTINQEIKDKPFIPYCYSNVKELLRQWYAWLWDKIKNNVPKVTSHRSTLPRWVTPSTSHMLKRVQTLKRRIDRQNKPTLSLILKHKKLEKSLQIALTEDQANYEEIVTSSRRFSDLQKYLNKINNFRKYPQKMFYKEKSTRDDTRKATFFNEFFISVYPNYNGIRIRGLLELDPKNSRDRHEHDLKEVNKMFAFLTVEAKITDLNRLGKYEEGKKPRTVVVSVSYEWQKRLTLMSMAKLKNYDKTLFVSKELSPSEFLIENKLLMKRRTMIETGVSAENLRPSDLVLYQYEEESGNGKKVEESN